MSVPIASQPVDQYDVACDKARRQLAAHTQDANDLKDLGLMLGLFAPTEEGLSLASPFEPSPEAATTTDT